MTEKVNRQIYKHCDRKAKTIYPLYAINVVKFVNVAAVAVVNVVAIAVVNIAAVEVVNVAAVALTKVAELTDYLP